jgi:hypothetical protein
MAHSALPHIWKAPDFPPEVHPFILSLMERFELSFPVGAHIHKLGGYAASLRPDSTGGGGEDSLYLIPSLLPEAPPAELSDHWPPHVGTFAILNRCWQSCLCDGLRLLTSCALVYSPAGVNESVFGRVYRFEFVPKVQSAQRPSTRGFREN